MYITIFILFFAVIIFQIFYGNIVLRGNKRISLFGLLSINIVLNSIISIVGFVLLSNELQERNIRCGLPLVGYMMLVVLSFIVLLLIIGIQLLVKYINRK